MARVFCHACRFQNLSLYRDCLVMNNQLMPIALATALALALARVPSLPFGMVTRCSDTSRSNAVSCDHLRRYDVAVRT